MEYELFSHRYAESILDGEPEFQETWTDIKNVIEGISEEKIVECFKEKHEGTTKSLSKTLNHLFKEAFVEKGWVSESSIFQDKEYSDNVWRLDFAKDNISIEVAFNHAGTIAWNLLKPVLASELNHVEKNIQTTIGVIICATKELQVAGNFDSAIGTFEKYKHHLIPLNNQLTTPILLIGLKSPSNFKIERYYNDVRKQMGRIVQFSEEAIASDLFDDDVEEMTIKDEDLNKI